MQILTAENTELRAGGESKDAALQQLEDKLRVRLLYELGPLCDIHCADDGRRGGSYE